MAPLRSSRSNRHLQQDSGPQGRMRGGVVDHDPTEGLPVRRWEMMDVTIKQDAKDEDKREGGKDGANPNWPWPELPLPKDFHLLPPHSQAPAHLTQELLRRARVPNKNPNIAVFNRETSEYERPNLNPHNPAAMTPVNKVPNFKDSTIVATPTVTNDPKAAGNEVAADPGEDLDTEKPAPRQPHERTFTLKRWAPLPQSIADKKPEPKYLADRRPGLPPLYGHQTVTNTSSSAATGPTPNISSTLTNAGNVVVGSVNVPLDHVANASAYRVTAEGTNVPIGPGLTGVMPAAGGQAQAEAKRRPPPPPPKRRRKGASSRSKRRAIPAAGAVAGIAESAAAGVSAQESGLVGQEGMAQTTSAETQLEAGAGEAGAGTDMLMGEADDAASSGTEEEEGSEEGEIDGADVGVEEVEAEVLNERTSPPPAPLPAAPAVPEAPATLVTPAAPATTTATTTTATATTTTNATTTATTTAITTAENPATATTPEVSIQPPSPDLLGNLESEIQGMEEGGSGT